MGGARRLRALVEGCLPSALFGRGTLGGPGAGPRVPLGLVSGEFVADLSRGAPGCVPLGLLRGDVRGDPFAIPRKLFGAPGSVPLGLLRGEPFGIPRKPFDVCNSPRSNCETRPRIGFAGRSPSCRIISPTARPGVASFEGCAALLRAFARPPRIFERADDLYPVIVFASILSLRDSCCTFAAAASSCAVRSSASIAARRHAPLV